MHNNNNILFCFSLISEYVQKYATEEALREHDVQSSSESSLSDFSEDEAQDMEL